MSSSRAQRSVRIVARKPATKPRKQPQQARSRATIDAILTAAARLLIKEGFDHASTNKIAEAAGVSIGSLYQYFPSKEALVAALAARHVDEMAAELEGAIERVGKLPLRPAVAELVSIMLRAHAVDPALHKVLIEQVPRFGRLERLHEFEARAQRLVHGWLARHASEIADKDLELAAFVCVTTVEALTHAAVVSHPGRLEERSLADEITDLVVRYLEPRPG